MTEEISLKSKKHPYAINNEKDEEYILSNAKIKLRNEGDKNKFLILKKIDEHPSIKFKISELDYYYYLKNKVNATKLYKKRDSFFDFHYFLDLEIQDEL